MSYILDALRKSQQERQRHLVEPDAATRGLTPSMGRRRGIGFIVMMVLVFGVVLGGALWLWTRPPGAGPKTDAPMDGAPVALPATTLPATPAPPAAVLTYTAVPFLWELPPALSEHLSGMAVTIHVYAQDPAQRILFINDTKYQQGDRIANGARVERIVAEGVILSYGDRYFKLPRPR